MTTEPLMVRVPQAAEMVGMKRSSFYPYVISGEVPSVKIGALRLVPVDGLRAWVNRRVAEAAGAVADHA